MDLIADTMADVMRIALQSTGNPIAKKTKYGTLALAIHDKTNSEVDSTRILGL
jgi:hypothetical protein